MNVHLFYNWNPMIPRNQGVELPASVFTTSQDILLFSTVNYLGLLLDSQIFISSSLLAFRKMMQEELAIKKPKSFIIKT